MNRHFIIPLSILLVTTSLLFLLFMPAGAAPAPRSTFIPLPITITMAPGGEDTGAEPARLLRELAGEHSDYRAELFLTPEGGYMLQLFTQDGTGGYFIMDVTPHFSRTLARASYTETLERNSEQSDFTTTFINGQPAATWQRENGNTALVWLHAPWVVSISSSDIDYMPFIETFIEIGTAQAMQPFLPVITADGTQTPIPEDDLILQLLREYMDNVIVSGPASPFYSWRDNTYHLQFTASTGHFNEITIQQLPNLELAFETFEFERGTNEVIDWQRMPAAAWTQPEPTMMEGSTRRVFVFQTGRYVLTIAALDDTAHPIAIDPEVVATALYDLGIERGIFFSLPDETATTPTSIPAAAYLFIEPESVQVGETMQITVNLSNIGLSYYYLNLVENGEPVALDDLRFEYDLLHQSPTELADRLATFNAASSLFELVTVTPEMHTLELELRALAPGEAELSVRASGEVEVQPMIWSWGGATSDTRTITITE